MATSALQDLPRPFYDNWWKGRREAAHALWDFHSALTDPSVPDAGGSDVDGFFETQRRAAEAGKALDVVAEPVWDAAYAACSEHDLDRELLGVQVEAARTFVGPVRFETASALDTFVRRWAVPHGRLLGQLADLRSSLRRKRIDELARAFFYLARILRLPEDVREGRLFIPEKELKWAGVAVDELREGTVSERMHRLLWKQCVRVRDALAQGEPIFARLSFRRRYVLKKYWMGALAYLNELERRDFDLWSWSRRLPPWRRFEVYLQVAFGRTSPR